MRRDCGRLPQDVGALHRHIVLPSESVGLQLLPIDGDVAPLIRDLNRRRDLLENLLNLSMRPRFVFGWH